MTEPYPVVLVPDRHRDRVEPYVAELEATDDVRDDLDRAPLRQ